MNEEFDLDGNIQRATSERIERNKHYAKRMVWVKFQHEGIHAYPAAATDPNLADVKFLASPHRHIFHFEVAIQVHHNDRDIEFIQFKRWIENNISTGTMKLNNKSCEMISDDLYDQIAQKYPNRDVYISVSEDDENGSYITYNK